MATHAGCRPTIGFLSSWYVYEGTTIDPYLQVLLDGVRAAATDFGCNLLLSCGVNGLSSAEQRTSAWPVAEPGTDFLPISPANTDGLIVVPHSLSPSQRQYLQDLRAAGYPIVWCGPEEPGAAVVVDNAGGIEQAFAHLLAHGHKRIAFIAGYNEPDGDSAIRLAAFKQCVRQSGLPWDERLLAYGDHSVLGGQQAIQQILATAAPFSAVLASNDLSCFGAAAHLQAHGLHIPGDIAVIGFDDLLGAHAHTPPLTTVRHPTFTLGYEAIRHLLAILEGQSADRVISIPTRLVVRQSCGCCPGEESIARPAAAPTGIAQAMAAAVMAEARSMPEPTIQPLCTQLLEDFLACATQHDTRVFHHTLGDVLTYTEPHDDVYIWHAALSVLRNLVVAQHTQHALFTRAAEDMLARAYVTVSERMRRRATEILVHQMQTANQLGLMATQLQATLDEQVIPNILDQYLPSLGIRRMLAARFEADGDDPVARSSAILSQGLAGNLLPHSFSSYQFPPPSLFAPDTPFQLALLPLLIREGVSGFVAFDAASLAPCAAIVGNLAAALRSSAMYREALDGRRLAEEASQQKSRFLSTVSHELRTPLSLVVGLSEMLMREQRAGTLAPQDLAPDLARIYANAQHLGRLVEDVLDLASSEAGRLHVAHEPIDLVAALGLTLGAGEQMAREKGLGWATHMPPNQVWVLGDSTRLRQVLLNLIANAVKFTAHGHITVELQSLLGQATVTVRDTGPGVPAHEQALIFGEFQRGERAARQSGLGLGLAISKQIVELMGGQIGIESTDTAYGSRFFFRLPTISLVPTLDVLARQDQAGDATSGPQIVLIVDDNPALAAFHTRLIHKHNRLYRVIVAQNGREALTLIQQTLPDVVLLDLMMPELDGFRVLEHLAADEQMREVPVIVLSARSLDESDFARFHAGVSAVLCKGLFSAAEIVQHVETAMARTKRRGGAAQRIVRKALAFIHGHYAESLGREHIASVVGITDNHLTACFHEELGLAPMTYVTRYRLREARTLLETSSESVTEIALRVGFSDSAYFSRVFQREVGVTPRAYRRGKRAAHDQ